MNNFPVFMSLSLLYFAAVSFSEDCTRLGKPHLASSFLLHDHPALRTGMPSACSNGPGRFATKQESDALAEDILEAIEPFNVAGLGDPRRRNWYPVDPDDLVTSASKLDASQDEVMELLKRCGFQLQ